MSQRIQLLPKDRELDQLFFWWVAENTPNLVRERVSAGRTVLFGLHCNPEAGAGFLCVHSLPASDSVPKPLGAQGHLRKDIDP